MPRTFLVRHAESTSNASKIVSGQEGEVPLTPFGHAQAIETGGRLSKEIAGPVKIVSSPLERAHHTANYIATALGVHHNSIIIDRGLIERHFGHLEGSDGVELKKLAKNGIDPNWRPVGGESLKDVQDRALSVVDRLHSEYPIHNLVIVSHGQTIKSILNRYVGTWRSRFTRTGNAEVREIPRIQNEDYDVFFHAWRCKECGHTWIAQKDQEGEMCHACPGGKGEVFESLADTLIWRALYLEDKDVDLGYLY